MNNLKNFYRNKKVLVTGHTGFKGSWLTQVLLNWEAQVVGIALKPSTSPNLFDSLGLEKRMNSYIVDIRDFVKIQEIIKKEKPDIVFHLAAQPIVSDGYKDPLYTFETNTIGTANILQAIKETNTVKAVVVITTDKVYENQEFGHSFKENDKLGGYDPYSASKAAAEIIVASYIKSFFNPVDYKKKHNTLIASARAGNVIGGGDWQKNRLIPDLIRSVFEHPTSIIIRSPLAVRPWQYVLEPLLGYMILAQKLYGGNQELSRAWNFGPNESNHITVQGVIEMALAILGQGSYEIIKDNKIHEAGLLKLDSSDAKTLLLWQPKLDLDETLKFTLNWYASFYSGENIENITNKQIKVFFNEKYKMPRV